MRSRRGLHHRGQGTTFAAYATAVRSHSSARLNLAVETGLGNDSVSLVDVVLPGFLRIGTSGNDVIDMSASTAQKVSILRRVR